MKKDWDPLEILRNSRHDWLNRLQLIKGHLALNRTDRVHELIEEMTKQARQESRLSDLGIDRVAETFLTFHWQPHPYELQYEITGTPRQLSFWHQALESFFTRLFSKFDENCSTKEKNRLFVSFQPNSEPPRIEVLFTGGLKEITKRSSFINVHEPGLYVEKYEHHPSLHMIVQLRDRA